MDSLARSGNFFHSFTNRYILAPLKVISGANSVLLICVSSVSLCFISLFLLQFLLDHVQKTVTMVATSQQETVIHVSIDSVDLPANLVKLVTMVQNVSSNVQKTVWITSVSVMEANVQHVFLENWETYAMLVSDPQVYDLLVFR